ncbi:MAG: SDR family NAD(P)-dependent oxidoreductase [Porticoccaceae bacterium]|nr:SDR family NAD(P)-dependent oxidoreductase [Porticoccaceae bacterium]
MTQEQPRNALVLGAGGGLGQAIVARLLTDPSIDKIIAVSRNSQTEDLSGHWISSNRLLWIQSDYSEQSMADVVAQLAPHAGTLSRVCICHGVLHSDSIWPEKRLEDISADALHEIFHANTVIPSLWLKLLHRVLAGKRRCVVAALSARVGSIGDNRMGGWYAYRTSKSALNMMLKTLAVEYARRAKNVKLISFHPGTTDTPLSKPFQASVRKENLFSTAFVADRLVGIMDRAEVDGQLSYLDWDGKPIAW